MLIVLRKLYRESRRHVTLLWGCSSNFVDLKFGQIPLGGGGGGCRKLALFFEVT